MFGAKIDHRLAVDVGADVELFVGAGMAMATPVFFGVFCFYCFDLWLHRTHFKAVVWATQLVGSQILV